MGYADISKRRAAQHTGETAKKTTLQTEREVVRFKIGTIYNGDERYVCLGHMVDKNGVERVKFQSVSEAKNDLRESGEVCDIICEECAVRIFNGVERATFCEDTEDIEDYDFRADKPLGEMQLADKEFGKRQKQGKSKKGSSIAGLLLIVIIIAAIRACSS